MTIDELIAQLEDCRDTFGGDIEVRLMTQPNWPFEYGIAGVTDSDTMVDSDEDGEFPPDDAVIYIVEGNQIGYGNKNAWNVCY
jgi:hypothetical protein